MTSWGLVATVDDPTALVAAMVFHHLAQGAREVFLFLDRPNPELVAVLANRPQVKFTFCDDAYWAGTRARTRPIRLNDRQRVNANWAYRRASVDWLLHCDADEFLVDGNVLSQELSALPASVDLLRLPNFERAFWKGRTQETLFEGCFRRPSDNLRRRGRLLYGRWAPMLVNNTAGYPLGKALTRTGRKLRINVHDASFPKVDGVGAASKVPQRWSASAAILHFDALTLFSWQVKMLRKVLQLNDHGGRSFGARRSRMVRAAETAAKDPATFRDMTEGILALGPGQRLALKAMGLLPSVTIDPAAALRRERQDLDLSPAAFDAAVRVRNPQVLETFGLD